jgi:phosphate transport system substrate-binding protein
MVAALAAPRAARASEAVTLGGTGSGIGLLQDLTARHAESSGRRYEIVPSLGSASGLRALVAGRLDIALTLQDAGASDADAALRRLTVGRTPVVIATRVGPLPRMLTAAEAGRLLTGQDRAWPDGTPARVMGRLSSEREWHALRQGPEALARAADGPPPGSGHVVSSTAQENARAIAAVEGSIGVITLGQVLAEGLDLQAVVLDGVVPGLEALRAGAWPLAMVLQATARAEARPAVRELLDFLASPAAAARMEALGYDPPGRGA